MKTPENTKEQDEIRYISIGLGTTCNLILDSDNGMQLLDLLAGAQIVENGYSDGDRAKPMSELQMQVRHFTSDEYQVLQTNQQAYTDKIAATNAEAEAKVRQDKLNSPSITDTEIPKIHERNRLTSSSS